MVVGNALALPVGAGVVQCCVTSPPYWGLRDYGVPGQLGLEATPDAYVANMVEVFREVWRVLHPTGCVFLNLGDSYVANGSNQVPQTKQHVGSGYAGPNRDGETGLAPKNLVGIPWRVAFALQADGWYLRQDIIWAKPNPMPESVRDRCTKAHEYLFLLTKNQRYYYDAGAIAEPSLEFARTPGRARVDPDARKGASSGFIDGVTQCGVSFTRNRRSVWTVNTQPFPDAHFAVMPEKLVEPCILAGSKPGDWVLDPFAGSGTVGVVCQRYGRRFVGVELNPAYAAMAVSRLKRTPVGLGF